MTKTKQQVTIENFLDGVSTSKRVEKRTVYENKNGALHINWLDSTKPCQRMDDGTFYVRVDVTTIHSVDAETLFKRLGLV